MVSSIDGCLVTHRHGDHSKSVANLIERGVPVFGNNDMKKFNNNVTYRKPLQWFKCGTFEILPFDVKHDVENYGFYIKSTVTKECLLYITDTSYCKYIFPKIDYLMIEANYSQQKLLEEVRAGRTMSPVAERVIETHMCIETLLQFIKIHINVGIKKLFLLHMSDSNSDQHYFSKKIHEIFVHDVIFA